MALSAPCRSPSRVWASLFPRTTLSVDRAAPRGLAGFPGLLPAWGHGSSSEFTKDKFSETMPPYVQSSGQISGEASAALPELVDDVIDLLFRSGHHLQRLDRVLTQSRVDY